MRLRLGAVLVVASSVVGCREFTPSKPAELLVSPDSLVFTGRAGGQYPPLQYLTLSETDVQPVRWTSSADVAWIGLSSRGDTLPFFLGVGVGTALVPGVYRGTVTVARPSTDDRRSVPVTLSLFSTVPLAGRWAGQQDSVGLALSLADSSGQVTGDGSLGPPARRVRVTGTYAYPTVTLRLAGPDTTSLAGSFLDDNSIRVSLSGPRISTVTLTLYRQ